VVGQILPFDTLAQLRQKLVQAHAIFARLDNIEPAPWAAFGRDGVVDATPFTAAITAASFYQTDAIGRASPTMAECVATFAGPVQEAAE
jgi:NADH-quinone oxidoreductase subunit G